MAEPTVDDPQGLSTSVRVQITGCPQTPALVETQSKAGSPALWMWQRLAQAVAAFEQKLDTNHEVGFRLVSFGEGQVFHAEDIGYWAPDMILFFGRNEQGAPMQLLQHVSQVSVLLVAAKKIGAEPARRIGFDILRKVEETKA